MAATGAGSGGGGSVRGSSSSPRPPSGGTATKGDDGVATQDGVAATSRRGRGVPSAGIGEVGSGGRGAGTGAAATGEVVQQSRATAARSDDFPSAVVRLAACRGLASGWRQSSCAWIAWVDSIVAAAAAPRARSAGGGVRSPAAPSPEAALPPTGLRAQGLTRAEIDDGRPIIINENSLGFGITDAGATALLTSTLAGPSDDGSCLNPNAMSQGSIDGTSGSARKLKPKAIA